MVDLWFLQFDKQKKKLVPAMQQTSSVKQKIPVTSSTGISGVTAPTVWTQTVGLKSTIATKENLWEAKKEIVKNTIDPIIWFSPKEVAFLKQVKAQWMDKNAALSYIEQKRQENAPKKTFGDKIISWMMAANKFMTGKTWAEWPTTFREDLQTFVAPSVWLFSWLWKVMEKTTWALQDYAGKKLFWESYWTVAWTTQKAAESLVWDQTKQGWFMIGETVGKNLPSIAATAWIWWPTWWFWARVIKWWLGWAASTEASSLLTEWRLATPKELAVWTTLWWVLWWAFWWTANKTKKITNILKETEKVWDKRAALVWGKLQEQRSWISKFFLWGKDIVKPSKRTEEAAKTIVSNIRNASTKPVKLFNQVTDKITEVANGLGDRLKNINIWSMTQKNASIKNTLKDLALETSDISKNTAGKITRLWTKIMNAKNADEVWQAAKELDAFVPESVKNGVMLSGKDQLIYNAWRAARESVNNYLDDIANSAGDEWVKSAFKTMSNLFHAKWQILDKIWVLTKPTRWMLDKLWSASKEALKWWAIWFWAKRIFWSKSWWYEQ